jgi:hypothetical protein
MEFPADELVFLRDLVKASRQRVQHLTWTDRDGTKRLTAVTAAEGAKLQAIAQRLKLSRETLLRQAAHIPASPAKPAAETPSQPQP